MTCVARRQTSSQGNRPRLPGKAREPLCHETGRMRKTLGPSMCQAPQRRGRCFLASARLNATRCGAVIRPDASISLMIVVEWAKGKP